MRNFIFVILLVITCSLALNLKSTGEHSGGHADCSKDGPHPQYFRVTQMLKFKSDEKFKRIIQGFMDYFHEACHEYQVGYVRKRISEILQLSPAENLAFFTRFLQNGFDMSNIDQRVSKSIGAIEGIVSQKGEGAHEDCSKDGPHPKYYSAKEIMKFGNKKFKKTVQGFMDYFRHACHESQVGYVKGRVSELIKYSPADYGKFFARFKKAGLSHDHVDARVAEAVKQVMEITSSK